MTVWREYYDGTAQKDGDPRPNGVDGTDVPATSGMTHDTMKTETEPNDEGIVDRVCKHLQCTTIGILAGDYDQEEGDRRLNIGTSADRSPINNRKQRGKWDDISTWRRKVRRI